MKSPIKKTGMGCLEFATFQEALLVHDIMETKFGGDETKYFQKPPPEFEARAKFFEKIIPMLEKIPAKAFIKSGWKYDYFKHISRDW
jgi:hypothetical protein